MTPAEAAALRRAIGAELEGNLLPFWRHRAWDPEGGFAREMGADGVARPGAPHALILTARLLWTFAALYRARRDRRDLERARAAARVLETRLRDREHGGYLFRVDPNGEVLDASKKTYGQAFAVYAWSELHRATGDEEALAAARSLFERIEATARDERHGGYVETLARDGSETSELRLSDKDLNAAKSMNAHLHLLEAYANLYRAWPDPAVARALGDLLGVFLERIIDPETGHLRPFFDRDWRPLFDAYTYGHDIEAAWLLCEAASVLGDAAVESSVEGWAVKVARLVLDEGLQHDGALAYEGRDGRVVDPNREWWCQAEAVVGLWQGYELTGDAGFAAAAAGVWAYVAERFVDRVDGEWFWRVFPDGSVDRSEPKVSEWKGPYHNVRMCLEMTRRIDAGREEVSRR